MRVVLDTNVLVSAIILPESFVGQIFLHLQQGAFTPLYHFITLVELIQVLSRRRIQRRFNITAEGIQAVADLIALRGELVTIERHFEPCRDPKDNIFLDVAFAGRADMIITGDTDLLVLHPFEGIPIVTPRVFLETLSGLNKG